MERRSLHKWIAVAVLYLLCTRPDGAPVWIKEDQIVYITPSAFGESGRSKIELLNSQIWVSEPPEQLISKLKSDEGKKTIDHDGR